MIILNPYSIVLLIVYFGLILIMSLSFSWGGVQSGFYDTFPIILLLLTWSQVISRHIDKKETELSKLNRFKRNFFIVFILLFSSSILELYFGYASTVALTWWSLALCLMLVTSLIFSLFFALIALCTKISKRYVLYFSLCLNLSMLLLSALSFWYPLAIFASTTTSYLVLAVFLFIHLLLCLYKRYKH